MRHAAIAGVQAARSGRRLLVARLRTLVVGLVSAPVAAGWMVAADRAIGYASGSGADVALSWSAVMALAGGFSIAAVAFVGIGLLIRAAARVLQYWGLWRLSARLTRSALAAFVATLAGLWVGQELSTGAWISSQSYAWVFFLGPGLALGACVGSFAYYLQRNQDENVTGALALWGLVAACGLASAGCAWFNAEVWFGLYPRLHIVTTALALSLACAGAHLALWRGTRSWGVRPLVGCAVVGLASIGVGSGMWLGADRATRSDLLKGAITATDGIRVASNREPRRGLLFDVLDNMQIGRAELQPLPELPRGELRIPADWNVLLVVSDAMRADAVPPVRGSASRHARVGDTPFLDRWLDGAYVFRYAYSQGTRTERSMPPLFRSLEPQEDPVTVGEPVAILAERMGRTPLAVVNSYFSSSQLDRIRGLLEGFAEVADYRPGTAVSAVPLTLDLLNADRHRPFFAWVHLYCLHDPGYVEGRRLGSKDGDSRQRYRRSLRWLDRQLSALVSGLQRLGLYEKTVIIFGSDHGENLGDNLIEHHGPRVFEETVRVPLAIRIPGRRGGVIESEVVGNIDIVPTIADMFDAPRQREHRGSSLVPLITGAATGWRRDYYMESTNGKFAALVRGRHKVVLDVHGRAVYRYNLDSDPAENRNLFDIDGDLDQQMLRSILSRRPTVLAREMKEPEARKLLLGHLAAVDPRRPGEELPFLLQLAAIESSPEAVAAARRILGAVEQGRGRATVIDYLRSRSRLRSFQLERLGVAGHEQPSP